MSIDQNHRFQNWDNQREGKSFAQQYLQSPLSISWSKLVTLLQSAPLTDQMQPSETEQDLENRSS